MSIESAHVRDIVLAALLGALCAGGGSFLAFGRNVVTRSELTQEMMRLHDGVNDVGQNVSEISKDVIAIDRRLSRIEGKLGGRQ